MPSMDHDGPPTNEQGQPLFIVNPRSGGGRAGQVFPGVRAVIERTLGRIDVAVTRHPAHAIDLARDAARQGRRLIVAVGGDGTLHEVANGVLEAGGGTAIGYVGQGTGGDFRRTLGIDHRLDAYVQVLASGRERRLDVGKLRYRADDGSMRARWFINILSVGMGGLVDRYVSRMPRVLGGTAAYFVASARALAACERGHLRCRMALGGEHSERRVCSYVLAVCNGRYFGGGMHVAPMARPDDGRFEVVSMDAPNKLAFARASRRIYGGAHLRAAGVEHFACDRIAIDLENDRARSAFLLDVDGEPLGGLPLDVELVPSALLIRA